jgi:hypothetical protein
VANAESERAGWVRGAARHATAVPGLALVREILNRSPYRKIVATTEQDARELFAGAAGLAAAGSIIGASTAECHPVVIRSLRPASSLGMRYDLTRL